MDNAETQSSETMDYRALLKKYMRLVIDREGLDFLAFVHSRFSSEELEQLKAISKEICR